MKDRLVTRAELRAIFQVSDETLRRWIRDGKLPPAVVPGQKSKVWQAERLRQAGIVVPTYPPSYTYKRAA